MRSVVLGSSLALAIVLASLGSAGAANGPGVTDTEIKIGQTMPYSGPASAYGIIGKTEAAYFRMINEKGGINGRKINFISLDDGYSPPKTVEQTRKLIEQERVLLLFNSLGTPTNLAIHKYVNDRKVPHILISSGAAIWGDYKHFPWSMGYQPNYQDEGRIFGKYILQNAPNGKIGVLYQNDDFGKDYIKGLEEALGSKKSMIISRQTYETTDPTVDSQIVSLRESGADVFVNVTTPKFAAQAIRKAADIGWKPLHLMTSVSSSVSAVMQPAGAEKGVGIITPAYLKDPTDPQWKNDKGFQEWSAFMDKYFPEGDKADGFTAFGYSIASTMVEILRKCGNDLSRENVMKQAASLDTTAAMLLPGIRIKTSPTNYYPIKQMQLAKFDGHSFKLFGDVLTAE